MPRLAQRARASSARATSQAKLGNVSGMDDPPLYRKENILHFCRGMRGNECVGKDEAAEGRDRKDAETDDQRGGLSANHFLF